MVFSSSEVEEIDVKEILASNIFSTVISKFLYQEEINNVYASCKSINQHISLESSYIYTKVCLHHQPHGLVLNYNRQEWYREGWLHSYGDQPAIVDDDEDFAYKAWYKFGKQHREGDQPASVHKDGNNYWMIEGEYHREGDQPAIVTQNGRHMEWYNHGVQHRDGDLPAEIDWYEQTWYKNGFRHRDGDKPAYINTLPGFAKQVWYKNGEKHREGEPAVIYENGNKYWYINGCKCPQFCSIICGISGKCMKLFDKLIN